MTYKVRLSMRRQLTIFAIAMLVYHLIFTFLFATGAEPTSAHMLTEMTLGGPTYFVCFFALVCGANLGLERSRYGSAAMLFPITRTRHCLDSIAVDVAGLANAYLIAVALELGSFVLVNGFHTLHGGSFVTCVVIPFGSFIALYGLSAFASITIGHGRIVGPSLAAGLFLALMLTAPDVPGHATFQVLDAVNPVLYLYLASETALGPPPVLDLYRTITMPEIAAILLTMSLVTLILTTASFVYERRGSTVARNSVAMEPVG